MGRGRYVLALTSDHGVAAHPEQIEAEGKDAGRIPLAAAEASAWTRRIAGEIGPGSHVATILYTDIYLTPGVLEKLRAKPGALDRVAGRGAKHAGRGGGVLDRPAAGSGRRDRPCDAGRRRSAISRDAAASW